AFVFACQPLNTPYYAGLSTLASNVLVFVASGDRNYFTNGRVFSLLAKHIGSRSYSMYLVHLPVFCIAHDLMAPYAGAPNEMVMQLFAGIVSVAVVLVLAEISYVVLESPLRLYGRRLVTHGKSAAVRATASA